MRLLLLLVGWGILLAISWPIALLVLVVAPVVWLLSLPLRLVGVCVGASFALVKSLLLLPARLLGHRG
ncbi:MAG TPA: hypothetical protein VMN79_12085 [Casimicrobiaceae bacterium]|nr:hypothetical protein [Casimicrobiaceae bacterium]